MTDRGGSFNVLIVPLGSSFHAGEGLSILRSALSAGLRLPSSCRNGTCRKCMCRLVSGRAEHTIAWPGLSQEEKAEGWILPCVAVARSDLEIDVSGLAERG